LRSRRSAAAPLGRHAAPPQLGASVDVTTHATLREQGGDSHLIIDVSAHGVGTVIHPAGAGVP
jgi:hypothetical protein